MVKRPKWLKDQIRFWDEQMSWEKSHGIKTDYNYAKKQKQARMSYRKKKGKKWWETTTKDFKW